MSNNFGLIPWGTSFWGIPFSNPHLLNTYVNIINVTPAPGSFNINRNQTFTFTIKTKFALNPNLIYVMLDNKVVINGINFDTTDFAIVITTNIDGISKDFSITPNYLFKDAEILTLQVSATDIYSNPAPSFWGGYIVVDSRPSLVTPIYPLDKSFDVPISLSIHFLVNQLAAPSSGLDLLTLNVYVDDAPAIINGAIQPLFDGEYSTINVPNPFNITDPFEIVLDCKQQFDNEDIVVVSTSVKELGIIPVIGSNGNIYDNNGVLVAQNIVVSTLTQLSGAQYDLVLAAALTTYTLPDSQVLAGYNFQDTNGNFFDIAIVGVQEIIVDTKAKIRSQAYSFITSGFDSQLVTPVFAGYFQGVYFVDNIGDGYHMNVTWHPARTTTTDNDLAYLIYYSTTRLDVFLEEPKLITVGRKLPNPETIKGADAQLFGFFAQIPLPVGVSYYFGIRATEYPHSSMPVIPADGYGANAGGRTVVDGYSFKIPALQTLLANIVGSGAIIVTVTTTTGYATAGGYIVVGSEIMKYTGLTSTTFVVAAVGRGLFGTVIHNNHNMGEIVKMYYGNYDDNTIIDKNVVLWEPPNDPKRTRPDLITTDMTLEDGYNAAFEGFDYCGYHRQYPDLLFTAKQCGTYVGGTYDGSVGLMLTERQMAVEEQLLSVTGEPVILLRRLWQGQTCVCRTSRKDIAMVRSCSSCFGVGFKGGFVQFLNPRENSQRIMVHFSPSDEDFGMGPQSGWDQRFKPNAWTLNIPSIKDRDLIVRFDQEDKNRIQWLYVVNSVSRGETVFGSATRQKLNLSRLDKTDVAYGYKLIK